MTGNKEKIATSIKIGFMPSFISMPGYAGGWDAIKMAMIVLGAASAAHIVLGSNPIIPLLAILTMALGMWPIARYGMMDIGAILLALIAFRYVGFPLFAKLAFGQALDTNLDHPAAAYTAVLLGVVSYLGAIVFVKKIDTGKPFLMPLTEPRILRRLSFAAYVIGFVANFDMALKVYVEFDAVTISYFVAPILHLALIAAVASVILQSDGRRIVDFWTLIILVTEVAFAFATNVRAPILEAFLCVLITTASFQGRISRKQIAAGLSTLLILVALSPVLLYVRGTRADLTIYERVEATIEAAMNWEVAQSGLADAMDTEALDSGYFMRYYGIPSVVLERLSHVNDVDVLISGADNNGTLGFSVLDQSIERALPRFIAPDKPRDYGEGDWIYCEFGVKCSYGGFLTAALIGVGYATFGWLGVISFPFILGLPLFLLIKKSVGFDLVGNVWTVFILVALNNLFVEGGASSYIATLFRGLPQYVVIMLILAVFVRVIRLELRESI